MDDRDNLERIGHAMMLAWGRIKKMQSRTWGEWMTIGEGLLAGRQWAMRRAGTNRPEGKGYVIAFSEWLARFKVDDMHRADRAKLLQLMEERPAVEEWRATLTDYERRNLNNPTVAWRKWTAATRERKPKPRTAGASASEMGRARATVEQLQARVDELEQELAGARESADVAPAPAQAGELELLSALRFLVERMPGISGRALAAGEASFDALDLIELAKRLTNAAAEWKRIAKAKTSA